MTEEEMATFLLKQAEQGHGNGQHPDDDHDYGRKKLSKMLPNYPSVVQKLVELEVKFRLEGFVGKVEKKWWNIF
jgi:hypothetical protein